MSEGLEELNNPFAISIPVVGEFVEYTYTSKQRDIIEKELKEHEQYKVIEQELGIDLVTLFEALKDDEFYSKHPETGEVSWIPLSKLYYCSRKWNIGCVSMVFNEQEKCCDSWDCDPKDYGKTWALTKEELE